MTFSKVENKEFILNRIETIVDLFAEETNIQLSNKSMVLKVFDNSAQEGAPIYEGPGNAIFFASLVTAIYCSGRDVDCIVSLLGEKGIVAHRKFTPYFFS